MRKKIIRVIALFVMRVTERRAAAALLLGKRSFNQAVLVMAPVRILFVDDSDDDVFIATHRLRKAGFELDTRTVVFEDELREAMSSFHPDIVVSDMCLPGFSGLEALDVVRSTAPTLPFVFLCGGAERCEQDVLGRGAYGILDKDHAESLPTLITEALAG